MAEIKLTQGKTAIVDDADLPVVEKYTWHAAQYEGHWYATTNVRVGGKGTTIKMHRVILGLGLGDPDVDHRDGDGLNNRRLNLRPATKTQNNANSIGQPSLRKSKYKGVHWEKNARYAAGGFWLARITIHGQTIRRSAQTEVAAARLYNELAKEHFGEFARFNDHTEICPRCGRWLKCTCDPPEACECPPGSPTRERSALRVLLLALLALLALATTAAAECTIVSSYDAKGRLQQCVVCYDANGHPTYIHCY